MINDKINNNNNNNNNDDDDDDDDDDNINIITKGSITRHIPTQL